MSCDFCNDAEITEREIARGDLVRAFPTRTPIVPGHVLLCPLRHVATFDDLTEAERTELFSIAADLKIAMRTAYDADGFNIAWNEGEIAGQSVPHFHMHLLPRAPGDSGVVDYEPRKFLYRPGSRQETTGEELRSVAAELRVLLET